MQLNKKPVTTQEFRDLMGKYTTGVSIVSVMDAEFPHGMTVNSFTSVSLTPTLILICLERTAATTGILERTKKFSVGILADNQRYLAEKFSAPDNEGSRFDGVSYFVSENGLPIIGDTLGYLECKVWKQYDGGDHVIFIGEVINIDINTKTEKPLLFYEGQYRSFG